MAECEGQEKVKKLLSICSIAVVILFSGCVVPLRGGRAAFQSPSGTSGTVKQPQNPKDEARQTWEREQRSDGSSVEKVTTVIGAAQKDLAREAAAKLASLRWVTWVGVLVFLFGVASAFWPPLRAIVGSLTTSAITVVAGLALIILPVLVVGHELLILGVAIGAALFYWFSHRHGKLQGIVDTVKEKL